MTGRRKKRGILKSDEAEITPLSSADVFIQWRVGFVHCRRRCWCWGQRGGLCVTVCPPTRCAELCASTSEDTSTCRHTPLHWKQTLFWNLYSCTSIFISAYLQNRHFIFSHITCWVKLSWKSCIIREVAYLGTTFIPLMFYIMKHMPVKLVWLSLLW